MSDRDWRSGNPVFEDLKEEGEKVMNVVWDNDYMSKAVEIVAAYVREHLDKTDGDPGFDVYIVWFSKTLQHWKVLLSTTLPDSMYYEVTRNGIKEETYLDAYKKVQNICIPDV